MSAPAARPVIHIDVDVVRLEEELVERGVAASSDIAEYALWLGDDALILAQQLGAWITRAPELEEDVALGNIALDLLGHARSFLHYAGTFDGRSEDDLAYWRDSAAFRCVHLVQQPNGDFAQTIARQFVASTAQFALYDALCASTDETLAAIAAKAVKEVDYHRDHATQWMLRLALGTDESRARVTRALGDVWPFVGELFVDEPLTERLAGIAVPPSSLRSSFDERAGAVLARCELTMPSTPFAMGGGRRGTHTEYLDPILGEMQWLARQHPGVTW